MPPVAADARRAEALGALLPPLLVAAERVAATVAQGVHGRRRVGQGDSFWQFRRFVTGDPVNRIDWRQSAKSGRPVPDGWFIRETEWEAAQTVCLWRDASARDQGVQQQTTAAADKGAAYCVVAGRGSKALWSVDASADPSACTALATKTGGQVFRGNGSSKG